MDVAYITPVQIGRLARTEQGGTCDNVSDDICGGYSGPAAIGSGDYVVVGLTGNLGGGESATNPQPNDMTEEPGT